MLRGNNLQGLPVTRPGRKAPQRRWEWQLLSSKELGFPKTVLLRLTKRCVPLFFCGDPFQFGLKANQKDHRFAGPQPSFDEPCPCEAESEGQERTPSKPGPLQSAVSKAAEEGNPVPWHFELASNLRLNSASARPGDHTFTEPSLAILAISYLQISWVAPHCPLFNSSQIHK